MFADKAYSLHGVLFMAAMIFCVVSCSFLLAFTGEKLYKRPLFWISAATLLFLAAFVVSRYLLLIAPVQTVFEAVLKIQTITGMGSAIAPFVILIVFIIQKYPGRLIIVLAVIALSNIVGTAAVLRLNPLNITDFYPVAGYFVFYGFFFWSYKKLFPELIIVKPEAFLKGSNDLIFVFDSRGRLLRASPALPDVFCCREGMNREEFNAVLKAVTIVNDDKTVSIDAASGRKYYQTSETAVKAWGGILHATVLMFSDVTEITELKAQLHEKIEKLEAINIHLEATLRTSEKLEAEMQKEIMIRELERTIGQKIGELSRALESNDALQNLPRLIETCRDIMAGVRQAVFRLVNK